jgi:hypothetical protein
LKTPLCHLKTPLHQTKVCMCHLKDPSTPFEGLYTPLNTPWCHLLNTPQCHLLKTPLCWLKPTLYHSVASAPTVCTIPISYVPVRVTIRIIHTILDWLHRYWQTKNKTNVLC